jgi:hypothetical protein
MTTEALVTVRSRRHDPRVFRKVRTRPYRRLDGTETTLTVWETPCIQCGAVFEVTASARAKPGGRNGRRRATPRATAPPVLGGDAP